MEARKRYQRVSLSALAYKLRVGLERSATKANLSADDCIVFNNFRANLVD